MVKRPRGKEFPPLYTRVKGPAAPPNPAQCAKGKCIVGHLPRRGLVKEEDWDVSLRDFYREVDHWIQIGNRRAEPHPGWPEPFKFCMTCGKQLENNDGQNTKKQVEESR